MNILDRYSEDTLFELEEMRSMSSIFIGKLITGLAFAYSMILMPWFLQFLFAFISVSVLVPLTKEYFFRQLRGIRLTENFLELKRGRKGKRIQRIHFKDVRRIELIEKQQGKSRYQNDQTKRTLFGGTRGQHIFHPDAKCVITLGSGKMVEIEASYFEEGDFELFLEIFERTYANAIDASPEQKKFKRRFNITEGNTPPPAPNTETPTASSSLGETTPTGHRYQALLKTNRSHLAKDLGMKTQMEGELREAYLSIYEVLDGLDVSKIDEPAIIYTFKHKDNSDGYILKDRFLQGLDEETIETAKYLIDSYHKNLRLVEMRIAYYKKIEKRLNDFMFQEKTRHKLKGLARSLEQMQNKNTNQTESHPNLLQTDDLDIENQILGELEDLTNQVHQLDDLTNAIILNEHISLFKK